MENPDGPHCGPFALMRLEGAVTSGPRCCVKAMR